MTQVEQEMVEGYLSGLKDSNLGLPLLFKDKSVAFKHGWLNGRDDRVGKPRENDANVLRMRADIIIRSASL